MANVKREQSKQLALKTFSRQVATRQINATSAEITPAKGAFVAKVKPEHGEQRALKNFFRKFSPRQTNATSAEISLAKCTFVANVKPEHGEQLALKTFSVRLQQIPMLRRYNAKLRCRVKLLPFHVGCNFLLPTCVP